MAMNKILRSESDQFINEIINLQLKKPKNWNWELSTSKSSPHITLPTIKLYNSKGKLLVEAIDNGMQRRSWHSSDVKPILENRKINNSQPIGEDFKNLRKSKSYVFDRPANAEDDRNNFQCRRVRSKDRPLKERDNLLQSQTENSFQVIRKNRPDVLNENRKSASNSWKEIINPKERKSLNHLRKSRSHVLEFNEKTEQNSLRKNRSVRDLHRSMQIKQNAYLKRTRSDDAFQRLMKYNEESMKRAIADGYRNFITPLGEDIINSVAQENNKTFKNRQKYTKEEAQTVLLPNNPYTPEINHITHKMYKTRTCSAGTLIISEESFNGLNRRRRRSKMSDEASFSDTKEKASGGFKKDNALESSQNTMDKRMVRHIRSASYPAYTKKKLGSTQNLSDRYPLSVYSTLNKQEETNETTTESVNNTSRKEKAFRANGHLFVCEEIDENSNENSCCNGDSVNNNNNNTNNICDDCIVQEPETPGSDVKERKSNVSIMEYLETIPCAQRKKYTKNRDFRSDTFQKNIAHDKGENIIKASNGYDEDAAVEHRPSTYHEKMGANVSRHSSKGLHGRRSQSSGSICNGKGRHASSSDSKMCGSLPSYLDDRNSSTCNNNHHDCEKPPLENVERIPPLGDAAPLHWKFSDTQAVLCDQGYGSERSPEEEYPPSLPGHDPQCLHHMEPHTCYPFITPDSTFIVVLVKGSRGLGLSVTGGVDCGGSWPGLIRIKRLFPHQPAATCGLLNVGDLLLEVNGVALTGLTNYEALEVLRTTPNQVELRVCRPPPDVLSCVSPISEVPPPPPRRDPPTSLNLTPPPYQPTPEDELYHGEFDITLTKIQGSLGFTLRKEDESALGHYVRALVREPALSDGRIRAGDKIIAVNDVEILSMTHEQAVQYLRQAGDIVTLRLYRDAAQTPVSTLSPSETTPRASFSRKAHLRPEALDMLNDIAMRKIVNQDTYNMHSSSPTASPRRLRRQPYSSESSQFTDTSQKYLVIDEQFHEALFKKPLEEGEDVFNSLFSVDSDDGDKPSRPSSLDLCNSKGTPVITRKPKFNFSLAHNAYELNNLDPEILDAPNLTYNLGKDDVKSTEVECNDSFPQEPVSMPHIPSDNPGFSYKNPAYQSAHPPCGVENTEVLSADRSCKAMDESNMRKWKGVVFNADEEARREGPRKVKAEIEYKILAIELNRGWNSRLGFSLQGAAGVTYVSAVHADSVAAKDGRLKPGDRLIKVNDESVESMSTSEIIDLLRIVRGPVCIVVSRCKSNQDCIQSNAEN